VRPLHVSAKRPNTLDGLDGIDARDLDSMMQRRNTLLKLSGFKDEDAYRINGIFRDYCRTKLSLRGGKVSNARYYSILGLPQGEESTDAIKRAYKRGALQWHPDRNPTKKVQSEKK
jgi:hypothetical protein